MKIIWTLAGHYERLPEGEDRAPDTSLKTLMGNVRALSTQHHCYHLGRVHRNLGLQFLPETTFLHLMHQGLGRSPQLTANLLTPSLDPLDSALLKGCAPRYRFVTQDLEDNFELALDQDDPQLPSTPPERWQGHYRLPLPAATPGADPDPIAARLVQIRQAVEQDLTTLLENHPLQVLQAALNSTNPDEFALSLRPGLTSWLEPRELPTPLRLALRVLKQEPAAAELDETILTLVSDYRQAHSTLTRPSQDIPALQVSTTANPRMEVLIGKGTHRERLHQLIDQAEAYLLICSYRLEDLDIVTKIAEKARQIPVWILTDFSDQVQDRVDKTLEKGLAPNPDYGNADLKKQACLRALAQAGVSFRSGQFHLKTYISEKTAYLGSCNLTGGSLGRNGEAGLLWSHTPQHQELIDYFCYLWSAKTQATAIPSPIGWQVRSISRPNRGAPPPITLLDAYGFKQDLDRELQRFAQNPQGRLRIYTRNFDPTFHQINLLRHLQPQICCGHYNSSPLDSRAVPNLHGKVILLGDQTAYLGSQDFSFGQGGFVELTYKTQKADEVRLIAQNLCNLD